MVTKYCLHRHSAQCQFSSVVNAEDAFVIMLDLLDKIRPLVQGRAAVLLYDSHIEQDSLESSTRNFLAFVNSIGTDKKTRWFSITRTLARPPGSDVLDVSITNIPSRNSVLNDKNVSSEFSSKESAWLSFSGTDLFTSERIEITGTNINATIINNCFNEESLTRDWPRYEPSQKHRLEDYMRNGELVSAMDLTPDDAQAALLISKTHGSHRYALVRGKIYRFIATNPGGSPPTFHGHRLDVKFVPQPVFALLED